MNPLNVIHCFRSPVGGLFRHVRDLVRGQSELGINVGLICGASTGGNRADEELAALAPHCKLGIFRLPMSRTLHWADFAVLRNAKAICHKIRPDIVHGHGGKGGAYCRLLAGQFGAKAIYTPHGGALHFKENTVAGLFYFRLERALRGYTDGIIFESIFSADAYQKKIGKISCPYKIIHNGLHDREFIIAGPVDNCYDFLFVGELRKLKGLDTLLEAMHLLQSKRKFSLMVAGDGPDIEYFRSYIQMMGLGNVVSLSPPIFPAWRAFTQAQCLVVPSLAESLPYIVLEAVAARVPVVSTRVGGIPEIFGPYADYLVTPNDPSALAGAMLSTISDVDQARPLAQLLRDRVRVTFRADDMVQAATAFYERILN